MPKTSINNNKKLLKGFFTVSDAVSVSMGMEGKLAAIEQFGGIPNSTKDGVTICRNIFFNDDEKEEEIGASFLKQACIQTLIKSGDGTSTAACLAGAIVRSTKKKKQYYFNKKVERGMQKAFDETLHLLKQYSRDITDADLEKIASISANNNPEVGKIIFDAYKAVGDNGSILVREGSKTDLSISKGMRFNSGYCSPNLINNQQKALYEADNASVLIYNGFEIHDNDIVKNWINANRSNPIVIIAERLPSEDWIRNLYRINLQGGFNITAIECPFYDIKRETFLEDIALYTGGEVFIQGSSKEVKCGKVNSVVVEQNFTSLIKDGELKEVQEKIDILKEQLKNTSDAEFIQARIQALSGISATITVWGQNPSEMGELKDRFDDAVSAIKSAVELGWIAGGGATLAFISALLDSELDNKEEQFGYNAFKKAILAPFKQICINANRKPKLYLQETQDKYGYGYNARKDESSNLIEDGIIDGCKSTIISLENAFSVSKLVLNTQVVITQ